MNKRLTRSEYIFSLFFIFMLICALAAFFYGVQIGTQRAEAKHALSVKKPDQTKVTAYNQQYLVSFYHTIFSPYREFQNTWFEQIEAIENRHHSAAPASQLEELEIMAKEQYSKISRTGMPAASPLLQDAQTNYLKSLKLFTSAAARLKNSRDHVVGEALAERIYADPYVQEAVNFALQAQSQFYDSIVKWNVTVDPAFKPLKHSSGGLKLAEWNKLNLNQKNAYIAAMLSKEGRFEAFAPQDLTLRIDQMQSSGNLKRLKLANIGQAASVLIDTGAVRPGDYMKNKNRFYKNERLPLIPLLTS
ncbi:hypothetical protein SY83_18750 [Paenibacillus swuensis]|uniref:Uncharacterized protein n=1 Tax=Paenibacillus swuensis TaxID=1178515 RepID=A0A172TMJ7_9BACL|nr:hypothetical protein [Paenibacillus swuensis]ANE47993.1 hypothetical protein SY83_18750 [Paenibacillus swuensis]